MKLMKHITIALVLCAIPAMAFGQTVSCEDCTHEVSVFMGEGGFVATADDDAEMVTWVATCEGTTNSGELEPNDDGMVGALFACDGEDEDNQFRLGPITDGGWYWITDADNSAVGNLVAMDILENDKAEITSAGEGVSMHEGNGAVLLKEASSGRIGILPNILPEPPVAALRTCGADDKGTVGTEATAVANAANAQFVRRTSECALGDGGTITLATTTNSFTGATTVVADKSTLVRPSGSGVVVVTIDLWGNHSGHFTTAPDGHALLGNPAVALSALRGLARLTGVTYTASLGTGGPNSPAFASGTAQAGITMDNTTTTNVVTFSIGSSTAYCSKTNNHSATVSVTATMTDATAANQTTPARSRHATSGRVGGTSFTVVCASGSSANLGQELVPDNPFPVE